MQSRSILQNYLILVAFDCQDMQEYEGELRNHYFGFENERILKMTNDLIKMA